VVNDRLRIEEKLVRDRQLAVFMPSSWLATAQP